MSFPVSGALVCERRPNAGGHHGHHRKKLDVEATAALPKSPVEGGWTCPGRPRSVEFFATRGLVEIRGTIDGHPFRGSFTALGDGTHKPPVRADVRKAIGKEEGDTVTVRLEERIGSQSA